MNPVSDLPRKSGRPVLAHIVQQHFDEAADGWLRRGVTVTAPVKLLALERGDRRIAANLAGLVVAEDAVIAICEAAMTSATSQAVFVATAWALQTGLASFDWVFSVTDAIQEARPGLLAGLDWTDRAHLQGVIAPLLSAEDPGRRALGVSACAAHRVDPGLVSRKLLLERSALVRTAAIRAAGELGFVETLSLFADALTDDDPECRFWAAWTAVLLGGRGRGLESIVENAVTPGQRRSIAFTLALQASTNVVADELLQEMSKSGRPRRWVIEGSGLAGDPAYIPWLLEQMADVAEARVAGEAFALITGADLDKQQLWVGRPKGFESGPNDDPDDPNVDMDPDEGLLWPDLGKIEAWWHANEHRFQKGTRYFMGQPVSKEHCIHVLKTGYQRQRILAAHYLCLLEPGTPLFNTSAPAWRQQRLLAAM